MRKREKRRVRIITPLDGVWAKYQPKVGEIYDADYMPAYGSRNLRNAEVCLIDILDKRIALRTGEYELLEVE